MSTSAIKFAQHRKTQMHYTTVAALQNATNRQRVNFYGIIVDCRALSPTRGIDMRSELILIDDTSLLPSSLPPPSESYDNELQPQPQQQQSSSLTKIIAFAFENNPKFALPFRAFGDIIRIHRAYINVYQSQSNSNTELAISSRQLRIQPFSTCLLWPHDTDSFEPVYIREVVTSPRQQRTSIHHGHHNPIQVVSPSSPSTNQSTHVITEFDKHRISKLRHFVKHSILSRRVESVRPFLRNVAQTRALAKMNECSGNLHALDLLCFIERVEYNDNDNQSVITGFAVSDGPPSSFSKNKQIKRRRRMKFLNIKFENPTGIKYISSFLNFVPAWHTCQVKGSWVLLKDATLVCGTDGHHFVNLSYRPCACTSTVFFMCEDAPLVRHFRNNNDDVDGMDSEPEGTEGGNSEIDNIQPHINNNSSNGHGFGGTSHDDRNVNNINGNNNVVGHRPDHGGGRDVVRWGSSHRNSPQEKQKQREHLQRVRQIQQRHQEDENLNKKSVAQETTRSTIGPEPEPSATVRLHAQNKSSSNVNNNNINSSRNTSNKNHLTPQKRTMDERDRDKDKDKSKPINNGAESTDIVPQSPRRRVDESQLGRIQPNTGSVTLVTDIVDSDLKERLRVDMISEIIEKIRISNDNSNNKNKFGDIMRIRVRCKACMWPLEVRYACHPTCDSCHANIEYKESSLRCSQCSKTFPGGISNGDIQWVFGIKIWVVDHHGARINVWIEGDEAVKFFDLQPTCLFRDVQKRIDLSRKIECMLRAGNWMDCCVKGYEYEDEHGVLHVACKMVATKLLSEYIEEDDG